MGTNTSNPSFSRLSAAVALCSVGTLWPGSARAEPEDVPRRDESFAPTVGKFAVDAWAGAGRRLQTDTWDTTLYFGGTALYRPSWLTIGGELEVSGPVLGDHEQQLGLLGGTTLPVTDWFFVDALAEFGAHFVEPSSGLDIWGESRVSGGDPVVVLPYAGLRLSPTFQIAKVGREHIFLGPWFLARQDLRRTSLDYTVEYCSSGFDGGDTSCSTESYSNPVGGLDLAGGVRIGGQWGSR